MFTIKEVPQAPTECFLVELFGGQLMGILDIIKEGQDKT